MRMSRGMQHAGPGWRQPGHGNNGFRQIRFVDQELFEIAAAG